MGSQVQSLPCPPSYALTGFGWRAIYIPLLLGKWAGFILAGMEQDTYRRMAEIQNGHWWYEARRQILRSVIARLKLPRPARVLEAGSGTGANLTMLAEFGSVQGFEPDDYAREIARKTAAVETHRGFLPDDIPYEGPYDLVCAFDVIEHVERDAASVTALYRLTVPGGYAVFTVPAFMFLWSKHDEVNHHFRRYTLPQFKGLLQNAGYQVEFISYYNMFLFPLVVAVRFLKQALKTSGDPDDKMPRLPFVNGLLRGIFAAERFLLAVMPLPVGVSVIAVCRRS
ncbi:MAG: class I SAM-dependent methyltransferase [Alphaproteobacteria bacterium]|nr:class I SAM-dependent methyltransferase [Alphaproteobacteria bacterium]